MALLDPQKIWMSKQLPTLPSVAIKLLDLARNPETELRDVVDLIRTDPATSAKILKAANSSYFAFRSEVTTIDRAVPLLGTTVVTSMALSFSLVDAAMTSGPMVQHYTDYWRQSVVQAVAAEFLANQTACGPGCDFFLAGLLMDLGRLAMLKSVPREYLPVLTASKAETEPLHEVERRMLGIDHVEIGQKLMEQWKLPAPIIKAAGTSHSALTELFELPAEGEGLLCRVLAVASAAGEYFCAPAKGTAFDRLQKLLSAYFQFSPEDIDSYLNSTRQRIDAAGELFAVNTDEIGDASELTALANEQLAQLAMQQHIETTQAQARQQTAENEKRELELRNRQLQIQAIKDPLTSLYNRQFFDESLEKEICRAVRCAEPVGVIFSDIDKFKNLNDTYGHPFGDQVLQQVARVFADVLRQADVLARYGGEEFVVIVNQPTEKGIEKVAERLRSRVEAEEIRFGETPVRVTVSVGAAVAIPRRNETDLAKRLLTEADEAMYEAKQNGRNQIRIRSLMSEDDRRMTHLVSQRRLSRWLVSRQLLDIPSISQALLQYESRRVRIGEIAQAKGFLTANQVQAILADHTQDGERFGSIAIRKGFLTEDDVAQLLAYQQEDPVQLGMVLVRLGLMTQQKVIECLQEYVAEAQPSHKRMVTA
ncbi:MAG: HDOD domain-containing protein [Planctomycetaceae bacterium]|nr:HDOD domain-containing protein [Planctomycetaceae bacterium]